MTAKRKRQRAKRSQRGGRLDKLRFERLEQRLALTTAVPVVFDDTYTLTPDSPLEVPQRFSVLTNDREWDRDRHQAVLVSEPAQGTVEFRVDGSFDYSPNETFAGVDSFSYRIEGGDRASAVATVTIGTHEALADVVRYRLEVVNLDGESVDSAPVGTLLELRGYVDHLSTDPDFGVAMSALDVVHPSAPLHFVLPVLDGDGFRSLAISTAGSEALTVGSLRDVRQGAVNDETLLFRAPFWSEEPGVIEFGAARPTGHGDFNSSPWPAAQWNQAERGPLDFLTHGEIDFGGTTTIDITDAQYVAPEPTDDLYVVAANGTLVVDAESGVLANDSTLNSGPLTARLIQAPTQGELVFREDGSFVYEQRHLPSVNSDRFYYVVDDGEHQRVATVAIRIDPDTVPTETRKPAWQNPTNRFDVNDDGFVTPLDGELVAQSLKAGGARTLDAGTDSPPPPFLDVTGDNKLSIADVDAIVDQLGEDLVALRLKVVDASGAEVDAIPIGDEFFLEVIAADLRSQPQGVFAAFTDISFDGALASVLGDISFGESFPIAQSGDGLTAGLIDEVGAARNNSTVQTATAAELVMRIPLVGLQKGQLVITADAADELPQHDVLLLGRNVPVPAGRIQYGEAIVTIGELPVDAPQTVADTYEGIEDQRLEVDRAEGVLANDSDPNVVPLVAQIVQPPAHGAVELTQDGSFIYTPEADFAGADRFSYRASNGNSVSGLTVVSLTVHPVDDDAPIAVSDSYTVGVNGALTVAAGEGALANDYDPDGDALTVELVTAPLHGELTLAEDGSLSYRPVADFVGTDSFGYRATDGEFTSEETTVEIHVTEVTDAIVRVRLEVVDSSGDRVKSVTVGDRFMLRASVEDVRQQPRGVFAAYADVEYDPTLVATAGEITFGDLYNNGKSGDISNAGLIDEAGAFTSSLEPIGGGEFLLFALDFEATSAGEVVFAGNPADDLPIHDFVVYGLNDPVPGGQVDFTDAEVASLPAAKVSFGRATLKIVTASVNPTQADEFKIESESQEQSLDVLANDLDTALRINSVSNSSVEGVVEASADGRHILYTPPANFIGTDRLTYTVVGENGDLHTADLTVRVVSRYQNQQNQYDTDGDGTLAPLDALFGINRLNERGARQLKESDLRIEGRVRFLDTNGDGFHSSGDVLVVINRLNDISQQAAEGEAAVAGATIHDDLFGKSDELVTLNEQRQQEVELLLSDIVQPTPAPETREAADREFAVPIERQVDQLLLDGGLDQLDL